MQNLKDTFYLLLRDRIAALNPARTVVVRGAVRPGVVALENELPVANAQDTLLPDVFCVGWPALALETQSAMPMTRAGCAIQYATGGTAGNAGMDRGRLLTAMDAELAAALNPPQPQSTMKLAVANGAASPANGTDVFWSEVLFGPVLVNGEHVSRTAAVEVFCYGR